MVPKCLKCRNSQVKSFSCPKPSWSSQTNYRLTKGAGSLTVIHLRNLGYEHLQNTWSSWWNCMAWSKSALLLELSWLSYSLLYFAPLAKSLGDKKVPDNGNIAKVFGKDTTDQGHECFENFKFHFRHHTTWPIFTKRQLLEMVVNFRSADWLFLQRQDNDPTLVC